MEQLLRKTNIDLSQIRILLSQVKELTLANMKARYRKTWAGLFWVVLNPVLTFSVQSFIFKMVLNINIPNYLLFLMSGLLPWIFIVQTLEMTSSIFTGNYQVLRSFRISPFVFLFSQVVDNFVNFLVSFLVLLLPLSLFHPIDVRGLFIFPFLIVILVMHVTFLSWFLATLHVFYRDTKFVVEFMVGLAFFLTPIFYSKSFIPEPFQIFVYFNPFFAMVEPFQLSLAEFRPDLLGGAIARELAYLCFFFLLAKVFWKRSKNEFYLNL